MDVKILIKSDVFNITNRVKQIDKGYYIYYNKTKKQYELHNKNQYPNSFCLSQRGSLDSRLIDKIFESDIRFAKNIFEEIEKENEKINREIENKRKNQSEYRLKNIFDYVKNSTKDINSYKMFSTEWL